MRCWVHAGNPANSRERFQNCSVQLDVKVLITEHQIFQRATLQEQQYFAIVTEEYKNESNAIALHKTLVTED